MEALKAKFQQLNSRERYLVIAASAVIVVGLLYSLLWQPLNSNLEQARKSVEAQQQTLTWLQQNIAKVKGLKGASNTKFSGSLSQTVNSSASRFNLRVARIQPGNNNLQVWLEDASFNSLLSWLEHLVKQGVSISHIDLAMGSDPGMVKIRRLQLAQ